MAREDDRDRVRAVRRTHRPRRGGPPDPPCEIEVGGGPPGTDLAERHPHRALEVGAPGVHGYGVDRPEVALQVRAERGDGARGIAVALEDDPSEAPPELLFDHGPLRPEVDATQ